MQGWIVLGCIVALVGWLFFGWFKSGTYTAYFYPNPNDYDYVWTQSGLTDLEACQSWVSAQVDRDYDGSYDYECGKNCKYSEKYLTEVCETNEK